MEELDLSENLTDPSDIAARNEMLSRAQMLQRHTALNASQEEPDEDAQGNRYCLDCADKISTDRRQAVPTAVRCTPCASRKEAERMAQKRQGIHHA